MPKLDIFEYSKSQFALCQILPIHQWAAAYPEQCCHDCHLIVQQQHAHLLGVHPRPLASLGATATTTQDGLIGPPNEHWIPGQRQHAGHGQ